MLSLFLTGIVVELESFGLNLERNELLLRFSTPVSSATFDFDAVTFIDHGQVPVNRYTLTGGVATTVNSTIVSVSLDERDVLGIILLPGLCTTPASCFLLYRQDLIKGEADEVTLPGRLMVKEFVPCELFNYLLASTRSFGVGEGFPFVRLWSLNINYFVKYM